MRCQDPGGQVIRPILRGKCAAYTSFDVYHFVLTLLLDANSLTGPSCCRPGFHNKDRSVPRLISIVHFSHGGFDGGTSVRFVLLAASTEDDYMNVLNYLYNLLHNRKSESAISMPDGEGKVTTPYLRKDNFRPPAKVGCNLHLCLFLGSPCCEEDPIDSKDSWGIR